MLIRVVENIQYYQQSITKKRIFSHSHHFSYLFPKTLQRNGWEDGRLAKKDRYLQGHSFELYKYLSKNVRLGSIIWLLNWTSCKSLIKSVDCLCGCVCVWWYISCQRITQTNFNHIGVCACVCALYVVYIRIKHWPWWPCCFQINGKVLRPNVSTEPVRMYACICLSFYVCLFVCSFVCMCVSTVCGFKEST